MKNNSISSKTPWLKWFTPPTFLDPEENKIARILSNIFYALTVTYFILIATRIGAGSFSEVLVLVLGLFLFTISFELLRRKKLHAAALTLAILLLSQVTLTALVAQGVRDLSVTAYPAILIVMSLMMHKQRYVLLTLLTLGCIAVVSLGAAFHLYVPKPPPEPGINDFIVLGTLTLASSLMAYFMANNMRQSLALAKEEISKREAMAQIIEANLHEKELLLKEIHHRVKNNLTVIHSLLNLQKKSIHDSPQAQAALDDMRNRILSMALVHEQLYKSDSFTQIAMRPYVEKITQELRFLHAPGQTVALKLDVDDLMLGINDAIPCGLVINEAVTNAMKHAFGQGQQAPKITIELKRLEDGCYRLGVEDNGRGIPGHVDTRNPESLGLRLMNILAEQLRGQVEITSHEGTRIRLTFSPTENATRAGG